MNPSQRRNLVVALTLACLLAIGERAEAQRILRGGHSGKTAAQPASKKTTRPADPQKARPAAANRTPDAITSGLRLQIALDRSGFSPGIIDGVVGRKTRMALAAFQTSKGLRATGDADAATIKALAIDATEATTRYALNAADLALIAPPPKKWQDKAKAKILGFDSIEALAAERGHCTVALLRKLNPGVRFDSLRSGDTFVIPNVSGGAEGRQVARLEVDLGLKAIRAYDEAGRQQALFHCSIAADRANLPKGRCSVSSVSKNPEYTFDPAMWPEVKDVDRKLTIPAGPRNPVGLCWIGLSLRGYGIHGTPAPEMIGKTGSHGCIRLTNWDALRLAEMVRVGTPVQFIETGAGDARSARRN